MKRTYSWILFLVTLLVLFGASACKNPKNTYTSPDGYDFNNPDKFNMPSSLLEISGVAFHDDNSDTVYSIQDEDGKIFRQKWDVKKQKNMKFSSRGDFEDLAMFHEKVFVLKSNGTLYSFPFTDMIKEESNQVKERKKNVPKAEYEGMYADNETSKLYILCKSCPIDKKASQATGYVLNYNASLDSLVGLDSFKLDLKQIKAVNPKLKTNFSPSALARNVKTNEWFILSSVNKMLLVTDDKWRIKSAHRLNSSTFNQPEGIAFDKGQNLYISNEGDEITDGNIIKFKYVPGGKK